MNSFWDELVERFGPIEDLVKAPGAPSITNKYIDLLQRRVLIFRFQCFKANVALDVGCGIGRWTSDLADNANHVIGIDISRKMIRIAKRRVRNSNVDLVLASAYAIPVRSNSVDLSLSVTCIQHISDEDKQKESLQEIARVTMGRILLLELMSRSGMMRFLDYPTLVMPKVWYTSTLRAFGVGSIIDVGVDFLPFLKLLEGLRDLFLRKLGIDLPLYGGSSRQRVLRRFYQIISVFALAFSLPFNSIFKNPPSDLTRHVLLVARKD